MNSALLYISAVAIWSTTWIAITLQVDVPSTWSASYRFAAAGLLILLFDIGQNLLKGRRILPNAPLRAYLSAAALGTVMFGVNYILIYAAAERIISGLNALIFAGIIFFNLIGSKLLLNIPLSRAIIGASGLGFLGLMLVLGSDLMELDFSTDDDERFLLGCLAAFVGTAISSCGHIYSVKLQDCGLSRQQLIGTAMFFGGIVCGLWAWIVIGPPTWNSDWRYVSSLVYLIVFGSVLSFSAYTELLRQVGPARASYVHVVVPTIAMLISTVFEGYTWEIASVLGLSMVIFGQLLVAIGRK